MDSSSPYIKNKPNSFNIFRNKKDLAIVILSVLLLLSVTGLYYVREIGEWLGKIIYKIYIFFYGLFGTLFFSTGQILNASSNVVADAAILTIDLGNDAVNDIGNILKGGSTQSSEHHKKEDKKNDKKEEHKEDKEEEEEEEKENMTSSFVTAPISTRYPSMNTSQSLATILQHGTPVPLQKEPTYWNF